MIRTTLIIWYLTNGTKPVHDSFPDTFWIWWWPIWIKRHATDLPAASSNSLIRQLYQVFITSLILETYPRIVPLSPCYNFPIFHTPNLNQIIFTSCQYVFSIHAVQKHMQSITQSSQKNNHILIQKEPQIQELKSKGKLGDWKNINKDQQQANNKL